MPRHTAWLVLRAGSATPLRLVDEAARSNGLDARDRGLLRHLVGTEIRQRGLLRALVARFAKGKPNADLSTHLRLGLAQLFLLDRIPPHAAVSETVRAVTDSLGLSKGRYVNAVLRESMRHAREGNCGDPRRDLVGRPWHFDEPIFRDPEEHPLLWMEDALSFPAQLGKRWRKRLGPEETRRLAELALEDPPLSVVVLEGEREEVFGPDGTELTPSVTHPRILLAPAEATGAIVDSAPFREGRITIQGEAALRACELVDARAGEQVLDLCAAPGGKSAMLARSGARVVSLDLSAHRLARLGGGLARVAPEATPLAAATDGTRGLRPGTTFDAVLLDAPCSNTGVLGARASAKWRFGPQSLRELVALQTRLLHEAAGHVRPGGRLVFSTCSLEPEEGERIVRSFLDETAHWSLDRSHAIVPDPRAAGPSDGGFAARLVLGDS